MSDSLRYKKASEVLASQTDYVLTHTNKLNDFTEGSAIETLFEADSLEIEMLYYLTIQNIKLGIQDGVLSAFGFTRKEATYAYGTVRLTFTSELTTSVYIPKGTQFTCSDPSYTQVYQTLDEYQVPSGTSYVDVPVYCTTLGTFGNIPVNTIDTTTDITYLDSVTNTEAFQTGTDEETFDDMVVRFREMIQSLQRGTVQALEYGAKTIDGIVGAYIFENTYGSVTVYCHDANGDLSSDLQTQVANELYYWKAAGIRVSVQPVHKTTVDLTIGINVPNTNLQTDTFLSAVKLRMENYLNSYTVGAPLYISDVIQNIMDISDWGIVDTEVEAQANIDDTLSGKTAIDDDSYININGMDVKSQDLQPIDISQDNTYGIISLRNTTKTNNDNAVSYKNAVTDTDEDTGEQSVEPIEISSKYNTAGNELIKSGTVTVYFVNNEDASNVDFGNDETSSSDDTFIDINNN
ncbi:baseplate J family protein [Lactobacillus phage LpeD]|uniref:Baseplate J family protein n=1 Tax=Lactobacillus phage LpeD TaxID=2041210 RepID=A0A291I9G5_9CAUD|nr:baseplate wedge subunit [Lactobacillus phage LpeD]ATG86336.1 baseplate J family protein [Lactobacillus phage LpeD]